VKLEEALAALYARVPLGMRLGLGPIEAACQASSHPERAYRIAHVAGTNGKGSTCAMVAEIGRAAGLRVGLYTSPHLCRFAERIRVDGEPIGDVERYLEEALRFDLSFFEVATLAAFLAFRAARVDLAVIEVGIGGRLDATNVVVPEVTAVTRVALDHADKLGSSLEEIAAEKAGIAKPGVPMVLGVGASEARAPALARGARIVAADMSSLAGMAIGLAGEHQRENAAVAWTIAHELGLPEEARRIGISSARWPGRLERLDAWILDGAHNPDGARALVRALAGEPIGAVVFGALADKDWRGMLHCLACIDAPRIYVEPGARAAVAPGELAQVLGGEGASSIADALTMARARAGDRPVLVCGSLYLIGAARAQLLGLPCDPAVGL
jgi:dihydrofolate synthase / folylpolyglutamate synthase